MLLPAAYVAWLAFGGFFGTHWLVLRAAARTRAERFWCVVHFACYLLGTLLLFGGGYYVTQLGRYVECGQNVTMSRDCLWSQQHGDYVLIYVAHYVGGSWNAVLWIWDAFRMPSWLRQRESHAAASAPIVDLHTRLMRYDL